MKTPPRKCKTQRPRAHWIKHQLVCTCGSRKFEIFREPVARKVHTRTSHRRRRVGICENGHKTRIGFPTNPKKK
jgi:hypothetical protein